MNQGNKTFVASYIKDARQRKGYTQQELSDLTGISIRSVQRIENGEVTPRGYTLRLLAEQLDLKHMPDPDTISGSNPGCDTADPATTPVKGPSDVGRLNRSRKIVLTIGVGIFLLLSGLAFISQSPRFPETDFEAFCFWAVVTVIYTAIIFRTWK